MPNSERCYPCNQVGRRIYECPAPVINRPNSCPFAPVADQVMLEPGIGQFREFESTRAHTCISSWGRFLVQKLTCGKR